MYTNIPTNELINILTITSEKQKQELMILINTIINQNYLQFNNQYYKQDDRLAMGAPTSAILAEIFIQHLKHTSITNILKKKTITSSITADIH
jgi:hypothetical protein